MTRDVVRRRRSLWGRLQARGLGKIIGGRTG